MNTPHYKFVPILDKMANKNTFPPEALQQIANWCFVQMRTETKVCYIEAPITRHLIAYSEKHGMIGIKGFCLKTHITPESEQTDITAELRRFSAALYKHRSIQTYTAIRKYEEKSVKVFWSG